MYGKGAACITSRLIIMAAMAVTLTACQTGAKKAGPPIANGQWQSGDGVYTAHFSNGIFQAVANDTGSVLSEGNYVVKSKKELKITWRGNVSQTNNSADCTKPDSESMNCVDANGKSFSLRRIKSGSL